MDNTNKFNTLVEILGESKVNNWKSKLTELL